MNIHPIYYVNACFCSYCKLIREPDITLDCLPEALDYSNNVVNDVQFLAQTDRFTQDLNISSRATGIHFVFLDMLLYSQKQAATDLHFMNHQGPRFQLNIFFTVLLKKKVTYILDGLRVSQLTANFHF